MRAQNATESTGISRHLKAFAFSIISGIVFLIVIYTLFSFLYAMIDLSSGILLGMVFVGIVLSGFASGYVAARLIGNKGMIIGALNGIILSTLLLIIGLCFFSTGISLMQGIKMVLVIFSSVCGGIFGVNSKKIRI